MKTLKLLVTVLLIISFQSINAQKTLPELVGKTSKKGKIILTGFTKIETGKLTFSENSVSFTDTENNLQTIPYEQISYVRYTNGNRKFFGTMVGAVSGTLGGFLGVATYKTYYTEGDYLVYGNNATTKDYIVSTSVGLVMGSVIGFGIGCLIPKWETTLTDDKNKLSINYYVSPEGFYGLTCSLKF